MRLFFSGVFRWEALTAVSTLALAVAAYPLLFDRPPTAPTPPEPAIAEDDPTAYTSWQPKSVRFSEAPASVASCTGTRPVSIRLLPLENRVEVDGHTLNEGIPIALSETCKVTLVQLDAPRDRTSGGTVFFDYRLKK